MITKNQHIANLKKSDKWIDYIKKHSGLPGKRANLELLKLIIELGNEKTFEECLNFDETIAPTNTEGEFVAMCGVAGLGKLVNDGELEKFDLLKQFASDNRWRVREAVAIAIQVIGENNFSTLIKEITNWKNGNPYEKRAIVAGLCEPKLLKERKNAEKVIEIISEIINSIEYIPNKKSEPFRVLRKGLGYGLSVAIVAYPEKGKLIFERLITKTDKDIRWILNENLKKKRLERMDKNWTNKMKNACA